MVEEDKKQKKKTKRIRIASIVYDEPIPRPPLMPIRKKSYENLEQSNLQQVQDVGGGEGCESSSHDDDSFVLDDSLVNIWCNHGTSSSRSSISTSTPSMSPMMSPTKLSFSASWSYPTSEVVVPTRRTTTKKPLVGILKKTSSHYHSSSTTAMNATTAASTTTSTNRY